MNKPPPIAVSGPGKKKNPSPTPQEATSREKNKKFKRPPKKGGAAPGSGLTNTPSSPWRKPSIGDRLANPA